MADYGTFQFGGTPFPLTSLTTNSALADADKFVYHALLYFSAMLNTHMGGRMAAEAALVGLKDPTGATIANAVIGTVPFDPAPYLDQDQFLFPLLAVYRKSALTTYRTKTWRQDETTVEVAYVLPPLLASQAERMMPLLYAAQAILDNRGEQGWDPSYTPPGGSAGDRVWGQANAALEWIEGKTATYGAFQGTGNLVFPSLVMEWLVKERVEIPPKSISGVSGFAGGDLEIDLRNTDQTIVTHFDDISTQQAPSVTSLTPTTGTVVGGTTVVITGTLFKAPCAVLIGNVLCSNIVVNSPTQITCKTGAHPDPGAVDVTVINLLDLQQAILGGGYTYTTP